MKKFPVFFLWLGLLAAACSTEVEIEGEWQDIPVVYGFLSRQDTAHYLRVEKAFLPRGGDARQAAQFVDSLYYDNIGVQLEKVRTGQRFDLLRVDGSHEGYPRREGPFAQAPNYLYKIGAAELKLTGGEPIRLILNRGDALPPVTAETTVLEDVELRPTIPGSPVRMDYDRQVNIAWFAGPAARIFDLRLLIHYRESVPGNPGQFQARTLEWVLNDDLRREDNAQERVTVTIRGEEFYRFLAGAIARDSRLVRIFDGMDLLLVAGGQELVDLLRVSEANVGVTSFQAVPAYTNLSDGRGIFSSRAYSIRRGLDLDGPSRDSLRDGVFTRELNFQ